jgi:hypothetical protein
LYFVLNVLMSTVVALIGPEATIAGRQAVSASNVSFVESGDLPEEIPVAFASLSAVWSRVSSRHGIFTLLDIDPLQPLVSHWSARLRGLDNELELAIGLAGGARLPDYYLVSSSLEPPDVDWYLSRLHSLAPSRVAPVDMSGSKVLAKLESLTYGTGFPPIAEVAASARSFVPLPEVQPLVVDQVSGLARI